jgi:hypothetical protein
MKALSYEEFQKLQIESSAYNNEQIKDVLHLVNDVSRFVPASAIIYMQDAARIDYTECKIEHSTLILTISLYKQKYSIQCRSIEKFSNVKPTASHNARQAVGEPRNIGVLSKKKLLEWINFYEQVYAILLAEDQQNLSTKDEFKKSLMGLPVEWSRNGNGGKIKTNGIIYTFWFEAHQVRQNIELDSEIPSNLETFLKLSDNRYLAAKPVAEQV